MADYLQQAAYNFALGDKNPPHRQRETPIESEEKSR